MAENIPATGQIGPKLPTLTITMQPDGNVQIFGPLNAPNGKLLCMQLIAQAILAVETFEPARIQVPTLVPPSLIREN